MKQSCEGLVDVARHHGVLFACLLNHLPHGDLENSFGVLFNDGPQVFSLQSLNKDIGKQVAETMVVGAHTSSSPDDFFDFLIQLLFFAATIF